jgi:hypothetical protein
VTPPPQTGGASLQIIKLHVKHAYSRLMLDVRVSGASLGMPIDYALVVSMTRLVLAYVIRISSIFPDMRIFSALEADHRATSLVLSFPSQTFDSKCITQRNYLASEIRRKREKEKARNAKIAKKEEKKKRRGIMMQKNKDHNELLPRAMLPNQLRNCILPLSPLCPQRLPLPLRPRSPHTALTSGQPPVVRPFKMPTTIIDTTFPVL